MQKRKKKYPNQPRVLKSLILASSLSALAAPDVLAFAAGRTMISHGGNGALKNVGLDYSAVQSINYLGRELRNVSESTTGVWRTTREEVYLYEVEWEDGGGLEMWANQDFEQPRADELVEQYATTIGRMPKFSRDLFNKILINKGDSWGGAGSGGWTMYDESTEDYFTDFSGFSFEEIGVHESGHNITAVTHSSPEWIAAQESDPDFLTTYARDYPTREDIADSLNAWNSVRHRPERVSPETYSFAIETIPARLRIFDAFNYDPYPLNRPVPLNYVDNTGRVHYDGTWASNKVLETFTNSLHISSEAQASATFSFTGVGVTYHGSKRPDMGIADVYVDGRFMASVDLYSPTTEHFQELFTSPALADGEHTITVVNAGRANPSSTAAAGKVNIDAFTYVRADNNGVPSRPSGLTAEKGDSVVSLSWNANNDTDFDSFFVYRIEPSGRRVLTGSCIKANHFLDTVPDNGSYTYEVTAMNQRGEEGPGRSITVEFTAVEKFVPVTSDEVEISGNWGRAGNIYYTYYNGDSATFTFNGRAGRFYGPTRPDLGMADVYVDGNFMETIDFYSETSSGWVELYRTPVLDDGTHTLEIRAIRQNNPAATAQNGQVIVRAFSYFEDVPYTDRVVRPFAKVNNNNWDESGTITANVGDDVFFGPWPYQSSNWSWVGPNGFRRTGRAPVLRNIQRADAGEYTATFINEDGREQASYTYTLSVNEPGWEPQITPYFRSSNQWWTEGSRVLLQDGDFVVFGPQPVVANGWTWTGPNGFSANTRSVTLSDLGQEDAGLYTATFSYGNGQQISHTFLVNMERSSVGENVFRQAYNGGRTDYNGWVGYQFRPTQDLTVSDLGRSANGALSQNHSVAIWRVSDRQQLAIVQVRPDSSRDGFDYAHEALDAPIVLEAGESYRIASWERRDGDPFRGFGNISNHGSEIVIENAVYGGTFNAYPGQGWGGQGSGYGVPSLYFIR